MKDLTTCYSTITPWMTQGLKLSGNKLSIYSIIYTLTQDDTFKSINTSYFCNFLNLTRIEFYYAINDLAQKKIIDIKKVKGKKTFYKVNSISIKKAVDESTKYFNSSEYRRLNISESSNSKKFSISDLVKEEHQEKSLESLEFETPKFSEEDKKQFRELMTHDWTYPNINFDTKTK